MATIKGYEMPDEMFFHEEHSWAKVLDDGKVLVGMSEFYAKEGGDIVYIDLPFEGDEVAQNEVCGKLQSSKWIGKLFSPISGEVVEVNEALEDDATLINSDPYGEGWIMKIEPSDLDAELEALFHGEDAVTEWIEAEIAKAEKEKQG